MESNDRLDLIARSRTRTAERLHSPLWGYVVLGVLWAAPLAALAAGRSWALFTGLVVVVVTLAWMALFTRRRGVRPAPFSPSSSGAKLAGWMIAAWFVCAVVAFATGTAWPLVTIAAAVVAASVIAVLSARIDRVIVENALAG